MLYYSSQSQYCFLLSIVYMVMIIAVMASSDIDVNALVTLEDIQTALDTLSAEEESVVASLDSMVAGGAKLDQRLVTISSLAPQLTKVGEDCQQLDSLIDYTCGLAEKVTINNPKQTLYNQLTNQRSALKCGSLTWPRVEWRSVSSECMT